MQYMPMSFIGALLLVACTTTVISDQERALPSTQNQALDLQDGEVLTADMEQSFIAFVGSKSNIISHEGRFRIFDMRITPDPVDPRNPERASVEVTIDIESIETDAPGLTTHLKSADFFSVDQYPQARFTSVSIRRESGENYIVEGDLTIRNVTERISFAAVITSQYMTMSYDLDRTMFGVGPPAEGVAAIDALVPLEVKIVFQRDSAS
ncbi:MAG: YceI family protein [Candidatus Peribacteraceae bacterium]